MADLPEQMEGESEYEYNRRIGNLKPDGTRKYPEGQPMGSSEFALMTYIIDGIPMDQETALAYIEKRDAELDAVGEEMRADVEKDNGLGQVEETPEVGRVERSASTRGFFTTPDNRTSSHRRTRSNPNR